MPTSEMTDEAAAADAAGRLGTLCYAAGDAGFNLFWALSESFLPFFLASVAGLLPGTVNVVLTTGRAVDLAASLLFGFTMDRLSWRGGRYRPYLLWMAVPLAVATAELFQPGGAWQHPALVRTVLYAAFALCYSVANVAYTALPPVLTRSAAGRSRLTAWRFFAASLTSLAANSATLWLTQHVAASGSVAAGWSTTATLYAGVGAMLLLLAYAGTRELPEPSPSRAIADARPWPSVFSAELLSLLLALLITMASLSCRGVALLFYVQDLLHHGPQTGLLLAGGSVCAIAACLLMARLSLGEKGQRYALAILLVSSAVLLLPFRLPVLLGWRGAIVTQCLLGLTTGALVPLLFSLLSAHPRGGTGARAGHGAVATLSLLCLKAGSLAGVWTGLHLLSSSGYHAGAALSVAATAQLANAVSVVPALLFLLAAATVLAAARARRWAA